jgi:hypothetical protein
MEIKRFLTLEMQIETVLLTFRVMNNFNKYFEFQNKKNLFSLKISMIFIPTKIEITLSLSITKF